MRTGDEYQEYSKPQFGKPSRKTHKWTLIDQGEKVQKFRCSKCKITQTVIALSSRYPLIRYDGKEGKAPECV
jgi:hypothetical protein